MWDYIYRDRIGILAGEHGAPLIFIQSGAGGTFNGYEDKYLRLAQKLNTRGYNVISSSNLGNKHFKTTMEFAQKMKYELFRATEMRYLGCSLGALEGLHHEAISPTFQKMILINPPLMQNYHNHTLPAIRQVGCETFFVFGEKDPSARYIRFLQKAVSEKSNFSIQTVDGADHRFTEKTNEFIDLAFQLLC